MTSHRSQQWFDINPRYRPKETIQEHDPIEESSQIPIDDKKGSSKDVLSSIPQLIKTNGKSSSQNELHVKTNSANAISI